MPDISNQIKIPKNNNVRCFFTKFNFNIIWKIGIILLLIIPIKYRLTFQHLSIHSLKERQGIVYDYALLKKKTLQICRNGAAYL